ncbi:MAG: SPOR domain-containing protein, partial [Bacteroidales bacterium]|nr:SPOR domain-containing protein [Bacteroidales bacterium]
VKLSHSLSYVADAHVKDLYLNFNPYGICGLYFWSEGGRWKPCCPANKKEDLDCMYDKPYELTSYRSKGHEVVYYRNKEENADSIFKNWQQDSLVRDFFLEKGVYQDKKWNAMGVAVFEGFASIWFGELADKQGTPLLCSDTSRKKSDEKTIEKDKRVPYYYVLVKSYRSQSDAQSKLAEFKEKGYPGKLVPYKQRYRVALGPYRGFSKAMEIKSQLAPDYKDAWIQNAEN